MDRHQLEPGFKVALNNVVRLFDLPLGAGITHLVDLHAYLQRLAQVLEQRAGVGRTGIQHGHDRHPVHRFVGPLLRRVDEDVAKVLAALGTEHVFQINVAAGMVGHRIAPDALVLDARHVVRLVLVELLVTHDLQSGLAGVGRGLEVIEYAQRSVDLPDVVRVAGGQRHGRRGLQERVRMQAIAAQGPVDGAGRQRANLTARLVDCFGLHQVIGPRNPDRQIDRLQALAVFAVAFHHQRRERLCLVAVQRGLAGVTALLARGANGDFLLPFEGGLQADPQVVGSGLVVGQFLTVRRRFGSAHRLRHPLGGNR